LFIEKYESYEDEDQKVNRRIDLSKNFRSSKKIIDGVNFIFRQLMHKEFGEIEYDDRAALYLGRNSMDHEEANIEFSLIERDQGMKDQTSFEELDKMDDTQIEAHFVAKRIQETMGKEIYDPQEGKMRKIQYRDIVVLLRSTKGRA